VCVEEEKNLSTWAKIAFGLQEQPFIKTATCGIIVASPSSTAYIKKVPTYFFKNRIRGSPQYTTLNCVL
jgi:hypothetical protein